MDDSVIKQDDTSINVNDNKSPEICFNIIQHEYDHVFDRGNKLDNKVNITLTFIGVLFLFVIDLFNLEKRIVFPLNEVESFKLFVYIVLLFLVLALNGISIYMLVGILRPKKFQRFNPDVLLRKNMQKYPENIVYTYVSIKYSTSLNLNNTILDEQYKNYRKALIFEGIALCLAVVLYILKYNFL